MSEIFGQFVALFLFFAVFAPLERFFALRREQKIFRAGWRTDILHFLCNRFLIDAGAFVSIVAVALLLHRLVSPELQFAVASQSVWVQFIEGVLIANFCGYWTHRLAHKIPFLWKFHAVHHSPSELDWLASARLHPFDEIFTRTIVFIPLYALGFTKEVFGSYLVISLLHGILNHSNVRFRLRFLRFFITTPLYHHWHHSNDAEAQNKNFAGQFPLFDILFGTFYLPKEKVPETYGISEPMPQGYLAQLKFPFRKVRKSGA